MSKTTLEEKEKNLLITEAKKAGRPHLITLSISIIGIVLGVVFFFLIEFTFAKVILAILAVFCVVMAFFGLFGFLKMRRIARDLQSEEKRDQTWDELETRGEKYLEKEEKKRVRKNNPKRQKIIITVVPLLVVAVAIAAWVVLFKVVTSPNGTTSSVGFTNAFGTPETKCSHPGCSNYIALSGDTSYCTEHSNRCLNCGDYCDEDAMYCGKCLFGN